MPPRLFRSFIPKIERVRVREGARARARAPLFSSHAGARARGRAGSGQAPLSLLARVERARARVKRERNALAPHKRRRAPLLSLFLLLAADASTAPKGRGTSRVHQQRIARPPCVHPASTQRPPHDADQPSDWGPHSVPSEWDVIYGSSFHFYITGP